MCLGKPSKLIISIFEKSSQHPADCVVEDMRFTYVDDLTVLELIMLAGLVSEYNFKLQPQQYC